MRKLLLSAGLLLSVAAGAADFHTTIFGGEFYFDIVDADALTCEFAQPDTPYDIDMNNAWLPSTVTNPNDGQTYTIIGIGENAFKDGRVTFYISGSTNWYMLMSQYWGMPETNTYIRAHAFEGFESNLPGIFRGTVNEVDPTAFMNNKIVAFHSPSSGAYKVDAVINCVSYDGYSNKKTKTAYQTSGGGIAYTMDGSTKVLVAYPGEHRREHRFYAVDGVDHPSTETEHNEHTTAVNATAYGAIGDYAFYGNRYVVRVDFNSSLTSIGAHAFENSVLTSLTLPASIQTIGEDAFKGVTTLTSITCNATTPPAVVFEDAVYTAVREAEAISVPDEALDAYKADENWKKFWAAEAPAAVELTGVEFSDGHEYATWYGDANLAVPDGLTAYVVSAVSGDEATITAVDYIPAATGVLLYSAQAGSDYTTVATTAAADAPTSLLVGYTDDTAITDGYLLWGDTFYRALAGTLPAHRCYLPLAADEPNPVSRVRLVKAGGVVTGIADVNAARAGRVTYVSVTGQTSDRPFSGVNIVIAPDGTVSKMVR